MTELTELSKSTKWSRKKKYLLLSLMLVAFTAISAIISTNPSSLTFWISLGTVNIAIAAPVLIHDIVHGIISRFGFIEEHLSANSKNLRGTDYRDRRSSIGAFVFYGHYVIFLSPHSEILLVQNSADGLLTFLLSLGAVVCRIILSGLFAVLFLWAFEWILDTVELADKEQRVYTIVTLGKRVAAASIIAVSMGLIIVYYNLLFMWVPFGEVALGQVSHDPYLVITLYAFSVIWFGTVVFMCARHARQSKRIS